MDAGFTTGANLTELIELGYDIDTKAANPAVVQALRDRVTVETSWTVVGKNAAIVSWPGYQIHGCPYPLRVGLERLHTPKGVLHAVLIRYHDDPPASDLNLTQWFHDYNGRQTIEAGNKEEKTAFKVQHLMSRSAAGIRIQALLTVFAANFVRWADEWIRPRIEQSTRRFDDVLSSPKRLVRIAANSPAVIERGAGREGVRFSHLSSFDGVVIALSGTGGRQLSLLQMIISQAPKRLGVWLRKTYDSWASLLCCTTWSGVTAYSLEASARLRQDEGCYCFGMDPKVIVLLRNIRAERANVRLRSEFRVKNSAN